MDFSTYKQGFWNAGHSRVGDSGNYVTDLSVDELCKWHNLQPPVGKIILDIGVGYGGLATELSKNNCVYGADISDLALSRIESICSGTFWTQGIRNIPPVDLAIAHLVFQHNPENEVSRIINDVNLKDDGIFSFQIATLNLQKSELSQLVANDINNGMLFFYSVDKIIEIVDCSNKSIVDVYGPHWHGPPFSFEWHIIKVKNKNIL